MILSKALRFLGAVVVMLVIAIFCGVLIFDPSPFWDAVVDIKQCDMPYLPCQATPTAEVFTNHWLIIALLAVLLPLGHLILSERARTRARVVYLLLLYALVGRGGHRFSVGFIPHVFFADHAAQLIGWPPGSPFQFEVEFHDGASGLLGFLCIWIGVRFGWRPGSVGRFSCWGHVWPYPRDAQRGETMLLITPDDLLGRFHSGLAAGAAVSLLSTSGGRRRIGSATQQRHR